MTASLTIRRLDGMWLVTDGAIAHANLAEWVEVARHAFEQEIEVASLSVVADAAGADGDAGRVFHAIDAALPVCFVNARVADLIGFSENASRVELAASMRAAARRNLRHLWLFDPAAPGPAARLATSVVKPVTGAAIAPRADRPLAVGIDASWLLGGESGAQVFVTELLRAVAARPEVDQIRLLSDSGGIPDSLRGHAKITGTTWTGALSAGKPTLDILHRPYQPVRETSIDRYRRIANGVAITVLDFIAYDNAAYHETDDDWAEYREAFDERLKCADQVVAISQSVADRAQRQYAHALAAPVRAVLLGTDHLAHHSLSHAGARPRGVPDRFALVLGNDFAHKNRDFAVRVFAAMCERGYAGSLVLAGYHLDLGSSYASELAGAGSAADRIVRIGPVSPAEKRFLLESADVVLYPTSCEGFGLVPFEAAALGTPCAFVRFGALKETMPGVMAAEQWAVAPFTDYVMALVADPARQVAQIRAAGAPLTWARAAGEMVTIYRSMCAPGASWGSRRLHPPPAPRRERLARQTRRLAFRVRRKLGAAGKRDS